MSLQRSTPAGSDVPAIRFPRDSDTEAGYRSVVSNSWTQEGDPAHIT